jgi:aryl-alcohol dehydrogenase-like predicted oxidoreductase
MLPKIGTSCCFSTKLFRGGAMGVSGNPNTTGCARKHIMDGLEASLERMQLKYVDLLYCHRPGLTRKA